MSAAFAFGGVGDIIAVCQIAWSLGKCLSESRGSSKEYQKLTQDLETFRLVLLQVSPTHSNSGKKLTTLHTNCLGGGCIMARSRHNKRDDRA